MPRWTAGPNRPWLACGSHATGLDPVGAWRDGDVDVAGQRDLLPALAHAAERQVDRALRQGLLQGYRVTEETSPVVRGRIREAEQMRRRFGATLPVEVTYDDFTTDIAENQILRAAVERLLRLPGVPDAVRRRLLHQRARLADATVLVRGDLCPDGGRTGSTPDTTPPCTWREPC